MLGHGELASGIRLDLGRAATALRSVGDRIALDEDDTARGILRIAAASMANAMREVSVEQGLDPREMVLAPFGGGGGYGPPSSRSVEAVRADLRAGYITEAFARLHYPHAM